MLFLFQSWGLLLTFAENPVVLRLVKNNNPFTVIVLFIFALIVKIPALIYPRMPEPIEGHFLYNYLLKGLSAVFLNSAFVFSLVTVIILFIQSIYIKNIATRHKLFPRYTYVPSFVYLLLTSVYLPFNYFNETHLVIFLLLPAVNSMFGFSQTPHPRQLIYNVAFLLSCTALFQFSMLIYFLLLLVGMVMFRSFNGGEWSVAAMGYFTPIYFLVCLLFLFDAMPLLSVWPRVGFSLSLQVVSPLYLTVTFSGMGLLLLAGVFAMRKNVALSNIYVRRDWIAISYYLIISLLVAALTDNAIKSAWLIAIPALSIIISHALLLEKNKRFSNFIFYFSLAFLAACLWLYK